MKACSEEIREQIAKIIDEGCIVIVEGIKDKKALSSLGIENIIAINRRALYKVVEHVSIIMDGIKIKTGERVRVVILTDLDKTGKKIYGKLNSSLQDFGVRIDNKFREFLFRKTQLRQIEGMVKHLERMDDAFNKKTD